MMDLQRIKTAWKNGKPGLMALGLGLVILLTPNGVNGQGIFRRSHLNPYPVYHYHKPVSQVLNSAPNAKGK